MCNDIGVRKPTPISVVREDERREQAAPRSQDSEQVQLTLTTESYCHTASSFPDMGALRSALTSLHMGQHSPARRQAHMGQHLGLFVGGTLVRGHTVGARGGEM